MRERARECVCALLRPNVCMCVLARIHKAVGEQTANRTEKNDNADVTTIGTEDVHKVHGTPLNMKISICFTHIYRAHIFNQPQMPYYFLFNTCSLIMCAHNWMV